MTLIFLGLFIRVICFRLWIMSFSYGCAQYTSWRKPGKSGFPAWLLSLDG